MSPAKTAALSVLPGPVWFAVDHIPADWVRQSKIFYVGGYLMMPGLETEAFVDLLRRPGAARRPLLT